MAKEFLEYYSGNRVQPVNQKYLHACKMARICMRCEDDEIMCNTGMNVKRSFVFYVHTYPNV